MARNRSFVSSEVSQWFGNTPIRRVEVTPYISASGGTYSTSGDYAIHRFNSNGTLTVNEVVGSTTAEVFLVAGGGSGGAGTGGGGGAGGLIHITDYPLFVGSYTVTIGAGGTNDDVATGTSGSNTTFSNGTRTLTALGGGAGGATETGNLTYAASNGGSGGGAQNYYPSNGNTTPGSATQPSTTSDGVSSYPSTGFGNNGSGSVSSGSGGGGGGAGAAASSGSANGGAGKQVDISGTLSWYAAGGSGGNSGTSSTNGIGGYHIPPNGTAGSANTGSGGGGGWDHAGGAGGSGGSGVVIVKYKRNLSSSQMDGLSAATAAPSAQYLLNNGVTTSGNYYITINGTAKLVYCDMTTSGGGWMLYSSFASDNTYTVSSYPAINGNRILVSQLSTYGYVLDYTDSYADGVVAVNFSPNGSGYVRKSEFLSHFYGSSPNGLFTMSSWNGPASITQMLVRHGGGATPATYDGSSGDIITNNVTRISADSTSTTRTDVISFDPAGAAPLFRQREVGIAGVSWIFVR